MSLRARVGMADAGEQIQKHSSMLLWFGFAVAILFGVLLYWLRCRHRVLYGAAEIVVALLLLYLFFFPEFQGYLALTWVGSLGPV